MRSIPDEYDPGCRTLKDPVALFCCRLAEMRGGRLISADYAEIEGGVTEAKLMPGVLIGGIVLRRFWSRGFFSRLLINPAIAKESVQFFPQGSFKISLGHVNRGFF